MSKNTTTNGCPVGPALNQAALTIAGSDPSGGAGIQADLKTFTAVGVYGAAVITCLTAQNSIGVAAVQPVAPEFVKQQTEVVLVDMPVSHIKTGMIGTPEIAEAIGRALKDFHGELICDPVTVASDGHPLFRDEDLTVFSRELIGRATVLTPNLPELKRLTGRNCGNKEEIHAAAAELLDCFPSLRAVAVKGGHFHEDVKLIEDFLILRSNQETPAIHTIEHPRIKTRNTHGTGCTFASAFTAFHLLSGDYRRAFLQTVSFMDLLLDKSCVLRLGKGNGPLAHHLMKNLEEKPEWISERCGEFSESG